MTKFNVNIEFTIIEKGKSAFEVIADITEGNVTDRYISSSVRKDLAIGYVLEQIANDSTYIQRLIRENEN